MSSCSSSALPWVAAACMEVRPKRLGAFTSAPERAIKACWTIDVGVSGAVEVNITYPEVAMKAFWSK